MTEAKIIAEVFCMQDMLHMTCILNTLGLLFELPMKLRVDNSVSVDISKNWSSAGSSRDMDEDVVQPKTYPFSTRHLILVNYKVLIQSSQPISLSFSYLYSARQNLVI